MSEREASDAASVGEARRTERGASLPLLALVLAALLFTTGVVIGVTVRVAERTRAQSAADAAALAGVIEGRQGAQRLAQANGAVLVSFQEGTGSVRVVVDVDGRRAEARAERFLQPATSGG